MSPPRLDLPSADEIRRVLRYDPSTGVFHWSEHASPAHVGQRAGRFRRGYVIIKYKKREYFAHRLAWLFVHGAPSRFEIDHVDCDGENNAIANLREATGAQNGANRRSCRVGGLKGSHFNRRARRWQGAIKVHGRSHLGLFDTAEEAHAAYAVAASRFHGAFARLA